MSTPTDDAELPFDGVRQHEGDPDFLANLAIQRGYALRHGEGQWLEWVDEETPLPDDSEAAKWIQSFEPLEPFVYPHLTAFGRDSAFHVPEPSFLSHRSMSTQNDLRSMRGIPATHVRDLAGRLSRDDEGRANPDALFWLIAYRDALDLDLRRCAARLGSSPEGHGSRQSPMDGARDTLRVWFAEAVSARGGLEVPGRFDPVTVALVAWYSFKDGSGWGDAPGITSPSLPARLEAPGIPRAVAVATVIGLRHHARIRDQIVAPAYDIWPRLLAAETVLHAALAGTPLDEAWIEQATCRQQDEDTRRAREEEEAREQEATANELRQTLLDSSTRLDYIMATCHPIAQTNPMTQSVWRDTHTLYVEAWTELGLPETYPYPTADHLKDAVTAMRRRRKRTA